MTLMPLNIAPMAALQPPPTNVLVVVGLIFVALLVGTMLRIAALRMTDNAEKIHQRKGSLITWWSLFALLAVMVLLGRAAAIVGFAVISTLGLREFRRLAERRVSISHLAAWAYAAVPVHYLLIYLADFPPVWTFIPVWIFCILLVQLVVTGETEGFLEITAVTFLGLMLTVFLLSHTVLLLAIPFDDSFPAQAVGLFVYLIVLTESNDIAQALWGRRFGRRKIVPRVSPNKTTEGFLLGAATTTVLACLLAPWLTPFAAAPPAFADSVFHLPYLPAIFVGPLIAVGGFFGDLTISAIKREVGVKDSGELLPGQGGVLDRIDSLIFTAPLLFYFTFILYA